MTDTTSAIDHSNSLNAPTISVFAEKKDEKVIQIRRC